MDSNSLVRCLQTVLAWLKDQPFPNAMALIQTAMMASVAIIGLFHVLPQERKAIIDSNSQNLIEQTKQIERISTSFEKALDRMSSNGMSAYREK